METLAVVAYRQPVVRTEIEAVRGVGCGEILRQLLDRDLIRVAGRSDDLGRPYMYGTTKRFLQLFGLRSVDELPRADVFRSGDANVSEGAKQAQAPHGCSNKHDSTVNSGQQEERDSQVSVTSQFDTRCLKEADSVTVRPEHVEPSPALAEWKELVLAKDKDEDEDDDYDDEEWEEEEEEDEEEEDDEDFEEDDEGEEDLDDEDLDEDLDDDDEEWEEVTDDDFEEEEEEEDEEEEEEEDELEDDYDLDEYDEEEDWEED
jgi:segregation and condensation protein B